MESLIEQGLEEDAVLEGQRDEKVSQIVDELQGVKFSLIGEVGATALDMAEEATIRMDNLTIARQMEERGDSALDIRMATGWERGSDGLWRYEIEDVKLHLDETLLKKRKTTLGQIVEGAEELFTAYPDLRYMEVQLSHAYEYSGVYTPETKTIKIAIGVAKRWKEYMDETWLREGLGIKYSEAEKTYNEAISQIQSVLVHEIQHAIQDVEGFAHGGNKKGVYNESRAEIEALWEEWRKKAEAYNRKRPAERSKEERDALMREKKSIMAKQRKASIGRDGYMRLAGEVEARNVQKRLNMSAEERLNTLLSETEDVAREDQIFLRDGVEMAMAEEQPEAGEFGPIFMGFKGNPVQAAQYLVKRKTGDAVGVFSNPEIGEIDLIWGDEKGGLAHIIDKHIVRYDDFDTLKDAMEAINKTINDGELSTQTDGRKVFYLNGNKVIVEKTNSTNWVLTAYDSGRKLKKKKRSEVDATLVHQDIFNKENEELVSPNSTSVHKDTTSLAENQTNEQKFSLITPEMDAAYLSAVERGDMATAQQMVMEAAKLAMPNTKVVDENGNPKVVYHQTNHSVYINRETGQNWDELDWRERMEWDERDDWDEYWDEREFNTFSRVNARTTQELDGFFFAPEYDEYHEYGNRTIEAFLNIENPASNGDYNIDSSKNNAGREERIRLQNEGYDGVINVEDGWHYYGNVDIVLNDAKSNALRTQRWLVQKRAIR